MRTSVLEFKLLEDTFCFNTKDIEYVFELEEYKNVNGFHKSIVGITKYNNDVMLLIDTAKLYSDKELDFNTEKSVVVVRDEKNMHYGMIVDEITKLEEIESVKLSVDLNTEDMVVNHYKDKEDDEIVTEIYPIPLFKKYDIPAMAALTIKQIQDSESKEFEDINSYLLFKINSNSYAIDSKYVKEVLEKESKIFKLKDTTSNIKGALAIRDEIISILEIEKSESTSDILVINIKNKKFGIEVDEVYDIENFQTSKIEKVDEDGLSVSAFYNHNGDVIAIINPDFYVSNIKLGSEDNNNIQTSKLNNKVDYLIFLMDAQKYSIDMSYVRQVVETESLSKTQSSSIVSSTNTEFMSTWNSKAVNILRLDKELNLSCKKHDSQSIFIEYNNHIVAFMVHDIENIVYLNDEDITQTSSQNDNIIDGAIIYKNEVIVKLNVCYISSMG